MNTPQRKTFQSGRKSTRCSPVVVASVEERRHAYIPVGLTLGNPPRSGRSVQKYTNPCQIPGIPFHTHYYFDGTPVPSHIISDFTEENWDYENLGYAPKVGRLNGQRTQDFFHEHPHTHYCQTTTLVCKIWQLIIAGRFPASHFLSLFNEHQETVLNRGNVTEEMSNLRRNLATFDTRYTHLYDFTQEQKELLMDICQDNFDPELCLTDETYPEHTTFSDGFYTDDPDCPILIEEVEESQLALPSPVEPMEIEEVTELPSPVVQQPLYEDYMETPLYTTTPMEIDEPCLCTAGFSFPSGDFTDTTILHKAKRTLLPTPTHQDSHTYKPRKTLLPTPPPTAQCKYEPCPYRRPECPPPTFKLPTPGHSGEIHSHPSEWAHTKALYPFTITMTERISDLAYEHGYTTSLNLIEDQIRTQLTAKQATHILDRFFRLTFSAFTDDERRRMTLTCLEIHQMKLNNLQLYERLATQELKRITANRVKHQITPSLTSRMGWQNRLYKNPPQKIQGKEYVHPHSEPLFVSTEGFPNCYWDRRTQSYEYYIIKSRPRTPSPIPDMPQAHAAAQQDMTIEEQNVTFSDQREAIQETGYTTSQTENTAQKLTMAEDQWHVREIMAKPLPTYVGAWATSQTAGQTLATLAVPGDLIIGPHYNQAATFTFFRGHPRIRIQLNGTKFHQGRLAAFFIPRWDTKTLDANYFSYHTLTTCPHVMLDASFSNTGVLDIPFVHQHTYFNTAIERKEQRLGTLAIVVFNRLYAADSASSQLNYTIWTSYDNCELHQSSSAHEVKLPKAQSKIEGLVKTALPTVMNLAANALPGGQITSSLLSGALNMDKPSDPTEISRWVPNALTSLNFGDGLDKTNRLSLFPGSATQHSADIIQSTEDDMNLRNILQIPARIMVEQWTTTQSTSQRLMTWPVMPHFVNFYADKTLPDKQSVRIFHPSIQAYISRGFKYWRGSLKYKIQVIASQMHSGRLMISYTPAAAIPTYTAALSNNVFILDLQEKAEVEITIPFMSERPWLRCDRLNPAPADVTTNVDQVGYVTIFVLNPLVIPSNVSNIVDVNVFVSVGDDFELAVPSDLFGIIGEGDYVTPTKKDTPQAHSLTSQSTVSTRSEEGANFITKGGSTLPTISGQIHGENFMNIKTIIRRYTQVFENYINFDEGYLCFPNSPTLSSVMRIFDTEKSGTQQRTPLSHYSHLFTFWRGSLRYKMVFHRDKLDDEMDIMVVHVPGVFQDVKYMYTKTDDDFRVFKGAITALGTIIAETHIQSSIEFEIPFYTPFTQLQTFAPEDNILTTTGTIYIFFRAKASKQTNRTPIFTRLFQAAGDDYICYYLRAPPKLQILADNQRDVTDTAKSLYKKWPTVPVIEPPKLHTDLAHLSLVPQAQGLFDYIKPRALTAHEDACNSIAQAAQTLTNTATKIQDQFKPPEAHLNSNNNTESSSDGVNSSFLFPILNQFVKFCETLPSSLSTWFKDNSVSVTDWICDAAGIVTSMHSFLASTNIFTRACALVSLIKAFLGTIHTALKDQLFNYALSFLSTLDGCKQHNEQPQAQAEILDLVAPLTSGLAISLGILAFSRLPSDKETTDLCKNISEKLRLFNFSSLAISNIQKMYQNVVDLVNWCIEFVLTKTNPEYLAQLQLQDGFQQIEDWAQFIDSLDNINYEDRCNYDTEFKNKIFRTYDQSRYYTSLLLKAKLGREGNVVREYSRKITEIISKVEQCKNTLPVRKDPICITLFGPTGVGKSGCVTRLAGQVMDNLRYPQHNRWCPINCNDKYFSENYRQQAAVYFDDFSAFQSEEQYIKFFNLKSNNAFPLDMAFRKGEYFNSDFIFMTTNTSHPRPNFITHHEALLRRRDLLWEARFINPALAEAAERGENVMQYDFSHVQFRLLDPRRPEHPLTEWMTFDEMVTMTTDKARDHMTRQNIKLRHDLTALGYDMEPEFDEGEGQAQAQAGNIERTLNNQAMQDDSILSLCPPDFLASLKFDPETRQWQCTDDQFYDDFRDLNELARIRGEYITDDQHQHVLLDLQLRLTRCSRIKQIINPGRFSRITAKISELGNGLRTKLMAIWQALPSIRTLISWSILILAASYAIYHSLSRLSSFVHACICKGIRWMGYRCGLCGKWPALSSTPENNTFLVSEWARIYGPDEPYEAGRVTSLEEERIWTRVMGLEQQLTQPFIGTQQAHGTYSTTDVKGQPKVQIMAHHETKTLQLAHMKRAHSQQHSDLLTRFTPCVYRIRFTNLGRTASMSAFAIGGRKIIAPGHFFYDIPHGHIFEIHYDGAWMPITCDHSKITHIPNKDLVLYELPVSFHEHRSAIKHFISEKDLPYVNETPCTQIKCTDQLFYVHHTGNCRAVRGVKYEFDNGQEVRTITVQNAWTYNNIPSSYGDCGSPLLLNNDRISGHIAGVHLCGTESQGWSCLLTREMLQPLLSGPQLGTPVPQAQSTVSTLIPAGHFGRIGTVAREQMVIQSHKSQIIPTKIHGLVSAATTEPSILWAFDPRLTQPTNPLRKGISKYGKTLLPFPQKHIDAITEHLIQHFKILPTQRPLQLLTDEQAITGIPELDGWESLPLDTSPGWPYVLTRPSGEKGKAYLFEETAEGGRKIKDPTLLNNYTQREILAKLGERIVSVWTDCLKDERRPLEKIKTGSTRVFTIPPVDFCLLTRKYCLDFAEMVRDNRHSSFCKVGIDCQSLEWTQLYQWLAAFSDKAIAGDFSNYDGTIPPELIMAVCEIINTLYDDTPENMNVRNTLFREIIHTVTLAKDQLYMTHKGNPSGNPLTVIINSLINFMYIALAWLGLCIKLGLTQYYSIASFLANVRMAAYGDDNLLAVKAEVLEWFNQESISAYLAEFGITYTNEEKTGLTKWKALDECSFLKQRFAPHTTLHGITVPLMKEQTILELLNWTRIAPDQDELLLSNITDSLRFAYFYGKDYFNTHLHKITDALKFKRLHYTLPTYTDMHLWFMHTCKML